MSRSKSVLCLSMGVSLCLTACGGDDGKQEQTRLDAALQAAVSQESASEASYRASCENGITIEREFFGTLPSLREQVGEAHRGVIDRATAEYQYLLNYQEVPSGVEGAMRANNGIKEAKIAQLKDELAVTLAFRPLEEQIEKYRLAGRLQSASGQTPALNGVCEQGRAYLAAAADVAAHLSAKFKGLKSSMQEQARVTSAARQRLVSAQSAYEAARQKSALIRSKLRQQSGS